MKAVVDFVLTGMLDRQDFSTDGNETVVGKLGEWDIYGLNNYQQLAEGLTVNKDRFQIFDGMPSEYIDFLIKENKCADGKIRVMSVFNKTPVNWTRAKNVPDMVALCAVYDGNKPLRYNDLILEKYDGQKELLTVLPFVENISLVDNNFIAIPVAIGDDVKRVINVVHHWPTMDKHELDCKPRSYSMWQLFTRRSNGSM